MYDRATTRPKYTEGKSVSQEGDDGNFSQLIKDSKPSISGYGTLSRPKTNQNTNNPNRYSYKEMLNDAGSQAKYQKLAIRKSIEKQRK